MIKGHLSVSRHWVLFPSNQSLQHEHRGSPVSVRALSRSLPGGPWASEQETGFLCSCGWVEGVPTQPGSVLFPAPGSSRDRVFPPDTCGSVCNPLSLWRRREPRRLVIACVPHRRCPSIEGKVWDALLCQPT